MTDSKNVLLSVELTDHEAWTYAQFLKRVNFSDYRSNAVDDDEAYTMVDAGEKIREALAQIGYAPR